LITANPGQSKIDALLLLGPTGSGKTPLGNWLEAHGFHGRPCHHFDFGANLRRVVERGPCREFLAGQIQFLRDVLERGALLENESVYLAEKILTHFIAAHMRPSPALPLPLLILNGLPRHIGQAVALQKLLCVTHVLQLECDAATIYERLRLNSGGDRHGRKDDSQDLVARKLQTYRERTQPLVDHYRSQGARILSIPISVNTQPADLANALTL
jgi:adenylate kinase